MPCAAALRGLRALRVNPVLSTIARVPSRNLVSAGRPGVRAIRHGTADSAPPLSGCVSMRPEPAFRPPLNKRPRTSEILRFLSAGAINTALTYGIYLALLTSIRYEAAYAVAFVIGVAMNYLISSLFVFKRAINWRAAFAFPLVYVVQLALGSVLLILLVEYLSIAESLAPLLVIILTLPITYLLARIIIVGKENPRT